ncbi:acetyl-CoA carboxylase biotin carboxyl carrier protein [Ligilactobacillus equi]|uniref:acetyl-CoA carboxylase biotin carboxyl carrier protein n=1 Tax=Ligilactobacillus equi TaxID=137357 RepID=UPI002ED53513
MDFAEVKSIMEGFNNSDMRELEITTDGFHLRLSKNENPTPQASLVATPVAEASVPVAAPAPAPAEVGKEKVVGTFIKAPMVGSIYLQSKPDRPAYVSVGSRVNKGDVVCIIEAMKMMTEIKSEVSGVIEEVLVENEQLVEFDQPLFRVNTEA